MGRIHVLEDHIINKIAAGEVVERPASVLKELLENALDAGATSITVELEDGGKKSIMVRDNGVGMHAQDAQLAITRHATSKIAEIDDLFNLFSMGFRGEALASIASISHFSLMSTAKDANDGNGIKLSLEGGQNLSQTPWSSKHGTSVAVKDLFFNTPARKKFLKSSASEYAHCVELVEALAFAHPTVGFRLQHNGKTKLHVPEVPLQESKEASRKTTTKQFHTGDLHGEDVLRRRCQHIWGPKLEADLLYCHEANQYGSFEGLISPPGVEKATGKHMVSFVNQRWVKDQVIRYGIMRGYHTHLLKGRYPQVLGFFRCDPSLIDVNVHPAKTQLRFQYGSEVQGIIALAIRNSLRQGGWANPTGLSTSSTNKATPKGSTERQPSTRSAPTPKTHHSVAALSLHQPQEKRSDVTTQAPKTESTAAKTDLEPFEAFSSTIQPRGAKTPFRSTTPQSQEEAMAISSKGCKNQPEAAPQPTITTDKIAQSQNPFKHAALPKISENNTKAVTVHDRVELGANINTATNNRSCSSPKTASERSDIFGKQQRQFEKQGKIPWDELEYIGVFQRCYLLFEWQEHLLAVDQHGFHERILFERLMADQSLLTLQQPLMIPESIEVSAASWQSLQEQQEHLRSQGFDYSLMDKGVVEIHGLPALLTGKPIEPLFGDLLAPVEAGTHGLHGLTQLEHVVATVACHSAIRAGERLGTSELRALLKEAKGVDFYQNCPHGRRVLKWFSKQQVGNWFDRT